MRRVAAQEDRKMYEVMEETMEDYIAEWMAMHGQPISDAPPILRP
jgi:hypothetical protein